MLHRILTLLPAGPARSGRCAGFAFAAFILAHVLASPLPCLAAQEGENAAPKNGFSLQEAPRSAILEEGCLAPSQKDGSFLCLPGYTTARLKVESPELQQMHNNWTAAAAKHTPENAFGPANKLMNASTLVQWKNLSAKMRTVPPTQQLQYINGFFNRWESVDDSKNYNQEEYWASPEEFLENGGDCEDYAIAKYFALRHFGWKEDAMWILLARDEKRAANHAVLAVREKGRVFILDNLSRPAYLLIPLDGYLRNNTIYYGLNTNGMYAFFKASPAKADAKSTGNAPPAPATATSQR